MKTKIDEMKAWLLAECQSMVEDGFLDPADMITLDDLNSLNAAEITEMYYLWRSC